MDQPKVEVTVTPPPQEPTPPPQEPTPPASPTPISEEELKQFTSITERLTRIEETLIRTPSQEELDWIRQRVNAVEDQQVAQAVAEVERELAAEEQKETTETHEEVPPPPPIAQGEPQETTPAGRPWYLRLLF